MSIGRQVPPGSAVLSTKNLRDNLSLPPLLYRLLALLTLAEMCWVSDAILISHLAIGIADWGMVLGSTFVGMVLGSA